MSLLQDALAASPRLLWGEFHPERALVQAAGERNGPSLIRSLGVDLVCLAPDGARDEAGRDPFGRARVCRSGLKTVSFPLQTMDDLASYAFAEASRFSTETLRAYHASGAQRLVLLEGPIQLCASLMPYDRFLMGLVRAPDAMSEAMQRYGALLLELVRQARRAGACGVMLGDDVAGATGPMIAPRMLRAWYFPWLKRFVEASPLPVFVHSDGDLRSLIGDYAEAGVLGLQSLEREAGMRVETLSEHWPDLWFWGGVSRQALVSDASLLDAEIERFLALRRAGRRVVFGSSTGLLDGAMDPRLLERVRQRMEGERP